MVERDCRVNFCVKAGSLLKPRDLEIVMPPFEPKPAITGNSTGPGPMFGGAFLPPGPAFNSGVYYGVPPPLGGYYSTPEKIHTPTGYYNTSSYSKLNRS